MTPQSLFIIILKVLGIFFLRDFIIAVPQFISLISLVINTYDSAISPLVATLLSVGAYGYIAYLLLVKTVWLIERLNLTSGIEEESITLNIHRSTILTVVVLIIGALMVVNALPSLVHQLILLFRFLRIQSGFPNLTPNPDNTLILIYALQIIIGLLVLGYQRQIVSYLELKRRRNEMDGFHEAGGAEANQG